MQKDLLELIKVIYKNNILLNIFCKKFITENNIEKLIFLATKI